MTSNPHYQECYVWIWLPGEVEPVVAGRLQRSGGSLTFNYGQSYLERKDAIPIYLPELPLRAGAQHPTNGKMASAIRDASPDAWGRRVILNRRASQTNQTNAIDLEDELAFLLESGSDRIGALDFQKSPTDYTPRIGEAATLEELLEASELVEKGLPVSETLDRVLNHGTSIGGARPKAMIDDQSRKFIAKFSASNDTYSVVKAEYIAMRLAALSGLDVAPVHMKKAAGKDVLLIERFDRVKIAAGWQRRAMVSCLTMLGLDEMEARYSSYGDLAEKIRYMFADPKKDLKELYSRMVFNILAGNTDDHARNHAAFWVGDMLSLTPAYDICPQGRTGGEAGQAMLLVGDDRSARITTALKAASQFLLKEDQAIEIICGLVKAIADNWNKVTEEADVSEIDRQLFARAQFLNPSISYGLDQNFPELEKKIEEARRQIAG